MATRVCANCGKPLLDRDVFCMNCGTKAPDPVPAAQAAPIPAAIPVKTAPAMQRPAPVPAHGVSSGSPPSSGGLYSAPQVNRKTGFCPECGKTVRSNWAFCMSCGQTLNFKKKNAGARVPLAQDIPPVPPVAPAAVPAVAPAAVPPVVPEHAPVSAPAHEPWPKPDPVSEAWRKSDPLPEPQPYRPAPNPVPSSDSFGGASEPEHMRPAPVPVVRSAATHTVRLDDMAWKADEQPFGAGSSDSFGAPSAGVVGVGFAGAAPASPATSVAPSAFPSYVTNTFDDDDDVLTSMYSEGMDEDDEDAPTMVYGTEEPKLPRCTLTRRSSGEAYEIEYPSVLGRGSAATVRVRGNSYVGRTHAEISERDGGVYVMDLWSTNHTYLNGEQLTPNEPAQMSDGDVLALGKEEFDVRIA